MKELIDKISTYNLFNYLLPGILFALFAKHFIGLDLIQSDIGIGIFLYYFLGMCISRIGSLIIEPILRKYKLLDSIRKCNAVD